MLSLEEIQPFRLLHSVNRFRSRSSTAATTRPSYRIGAELEEAPDWCFFGDPQKNPVTYYC